MRMNNKKQFSDLLKLAKTMRKKSFWHREQTIEKWTRYILEEAKEIKEAARKIDWQELHEEIGDLMWVLVFLSQLAEEQRLFSIHDSIDSAHKKIVRRHPHVFANQKVSLKEWLSNRKEYHGRYNQIKQQEKEAKKRKLKKKKWKK